MSGKKDNKVQTFTEEQTPGQMNYALKLKSLKAAMIAAKDEYYEARRDCLHTISYTIDTRWGGNPEGSCWCEVCDMDFGHYCPDSPDHACHYRTIGDGLHVKLNTGEVVQKRKREYSPDWDFITVEPDCRPYENDDDCLFCGQPQERK